MKVTMVILEYAPITGGAQQQLASLVPLLRRRDVEVEILTRRVPGWPRVETIGGARVVRLPAPGPKALASLVFTVAALLRLWREPPDVVHAYSLFSPTTVAILAARGLGLPTVAKVLRGGVAGDVARLVAKPGSGPRRRGLVRRISAVVAISREIEAELASVGVPASRIVSIPNGVDLDRFRPPKEADRKALRADEAHPEAPRVVFCGRLVPEKRVDLLLAAWDRVQRRRPEARLSIVGSGPCESALRRRGSAGVRFEGERRDVVPALQAADVFVLPSDAEGLSNALLEAMAVGLPVVATRVGGAVDLVESGRTGVLVPPGDAGALADALVALLDDPDRARLGTNARRRLEATHSLSAVADRLAALYRDVAARRAVVDGGGQAR